MPTLMAIFVQKTYVLVTPVYISNISAITDSIFTTNFGPKTQVLLVLLLFLVVVVVAAAAVVDVVLVEVESFCFISDPPHVGDNIPGTCKISYSLVSSSYINTMGVTRGF